MERGEREGKRWFGELEGKNREIQRKERWEKIEDSRYSRWYGKIKGKGTPKYLKKDWGGRQMTEGGEI